MTDVLKELALSVPRHVANYGFVLSKSPVCGDWFLYSDNGKGMGRQWIANIPAGRHYFGSLAQFMEAAHPAAILSLYARVEAAETGMEAAISEAEKRGHEAGIIEARQMALDAAWAVVLADRDALSRKGAYSVAQAIAGCFDMPLQNQIGPDLSQVERS